MKTIKFTLVAALVTLGLSFCMGISNASAQGYGGQQYDEDDRDVSYQTFYDELSPYGDWIYDNQYGYVWRPDMGPDFMPYRSGGHWVSSEIGWTWASDYSWGWAPFHYGRWKFDTYLGWYWIPGYEWAPAWVVWSSNSDYYGWAPMAPGWNINVSINIGSIPSNYWVFAPPRYISSVRLFAYCAPVYSNITIVRNVTVVNNYSYYNRTRYTCGPRVHEYNSRPGCYTRPVPVRECHEPRSTRCDNQNVYVYRPRIVNRPSCRPADIRGKEYFANRETQPRSRNDYPGNSRPKYGYDNNRSNDSYRTDNRFENSRQRTEAPQQENRRNDNWTNQQPDSRRNDSRPNQQRDYNQQGQQKTERYAQQQPQQQERRSQPEYRQVSQSQERHSRESSSSQSPERSSRGQQQRSERNESHSEGRPRGRN
ncbi:hypothetical protein NF867_17675 [Solitalea sp. MAHUQ-68]|uniref:Uncharacterized protein n=1 Tax=Solitalea agri TaxID=2953739 RepID=A0A9X2F5H5_9SPHI|nr:DUF6600 domain-containing protein [Solitalea agri]MCO4294696.1 hypothetical protein [Solitalea agri]